MLVTVSMWEVRARGEERQRKRNDDVEVHRE